MKYLCLGNQLTAYSKGCSGIYSTMIVHGFPLCWSCIIVNVCVCERMTIHGLQWVVSVVMSLLLVPVVSVCCHSWSFAFLFALNIVVMSCDITKVFPILSAVYGFTWFNWQFSIAGCHFMCWSRLIRKSYNGSLLFLLYILISYFSYLFRGIPTVTLWHLTGFN